MASMKTRTRAVPLVLLLLLLAAASRQAAPAADEAESVAPGCPPERTQDGEVRLVFLADSGYGNGFSEWGAHGQEGIASQIDRLRLEPDLVFFLGDNVYWRGSADLYKARFDDMYDGLIRQCKAHVALGNHDLKGCRAVSEFEHWESCLEELRTATAADRKRPPASWPRRPSRNARRTACRETPRPTRTRGRGRRPATPAWP
jgi:hypothetical protein